MRNVAGRAFLRRVPRDGLAIAGVIGVVLLGARALPLTGEAAEWAPYLLLGVALPLGVIAQARVAAPRLAGAMAVIGALAALGYVGWSGHWLAVPAGAAQVLLAAAVTRRRPAAGELVVAVFAWAAVSTLTRSIGQEIGTLGELVAASRPAALALDAALATWLTISVTAGRRARADGGTFRHRAGLVASLCLVALESFRVDYLFDVMSTHHWGAFVTPAEAVRQGGWLLWDTPAMYGPGATLAIAAIPTDVWDAFFWLNVLACFVSATLLLASLRACMDGVLALALTLCAVLWLPGAHHGMGDGGVLLTPNAGPFRFVWCQALLFIAARKPLGTGMLLGTCLLWLVGCLWSFESAIYCSAAWLPAYLLLVWQRPARTRLAYLAVPPLLIAGAAAGTVAYYVRRLGHGPDWYGYVETAFGVTGGATALDIEPWGPVAVLVLVVWMTASTAVRTTATMRSPADSAPIWAALALGWAIASYFVGRSHPIAVTNLLPTLLLVLAVALREPAMDAAARMGCVVLFSAVLLIAVHDPSTWAPHGPITQRWALRVTPRRLTLNAAQLELMDQAGIRRGSAIAYLDANPLPAWPSDTTLTPDRIWVSTLPIGLMGQMGYERRSLYVERFVQRRRLEGWLIERTSWTPNPRWLSEPIARTHRAERTVTVAGWRATYYEFVGK